jgi:hypothetical protein
MRFLFAEMVGQFGVARFEQSVVKGEGAVLATVEPAVVGLWLGRA